MLLSDANVTTKNNIQLVFFDVDGTLLAQDGNYSPSLKQQIHRLHSLGVKTAIASGRPSYAAQFLFDELGICDLGVFCTGAEIYLPSAKQHIQLHTLDKARVALLAQRAKALGIYCELYTPNYHAVEQVSDISRVHAQHLRVAPLIADQETVLSDELPIIKLLLGRDKTSNENSLAMLASEFPELEFAFAHFLARPNWEFASVISPLANKQAAFELITGHYNIAAENVMSIGDSPSDISFIQQAGVGVAMGSAAEQVKLEANYITLSADDDGVAFALQRLV
ncbi:MAG: Cof subfamily protein (haloacid dehalogenase superfamily) [Kiritimatiellia bacterium]|jgi:Cof subfamily protein (haloacid dehalogenase superfamily)